MRRRSASRASARCSPRSARASIFIWRRRRTSIDTRSGITVETAKGTINARTAIVTVPTNVVSSGGLKFSPDLGHHQIDAFGRMSLGSYDHIALELHRQSARASKATIWCLKNRPIRTPRRCSPMCPARALPDRRRRRVRPRSFGARRGRDDRFRRRLAGRALRLGDQEARSAASTPRAGTPILTRSAPGRPRCRAASSRAGNCWIRSPTMSGMPAKPRTRPCGAPWAAPGNPANAPPTRCCASSARSEQQRRRKRRRSRSIKPVHARAERREPRREATTPQYYGGTPSIMRGEILKALGRNSLNRTKEQAIEGA